MALDISDLTDFYATPLGGHVTARLAASVRQIWPHPAGADELVLGYGYALPLRDLWPHADWHFIMPAQQGVMAGADRRSAVLADERHWPVRDDSVNRLLVLHGLEAANQVELLLDEAWRVLRPNGRALFIIANRTGLWARGDKTPFGAGRPFSSPQIRQVLRRTGFLPGRMRPALMLSPHLPLALSRRLHRVEKLMGLVAPRLGGVWLAEAIKQVPAPLSVERARKARARHSVGVPRPVLSPRR